MADEKANPITAAEPPKAAGIGGASAHTSTLKLKPVIRKPGEAGVKPAIHRPGAPAAAPAANPADAAVASAGAAKPMDQLKSITQNMKSITSAIPQQAILRRTGIIAESDLTEAQKLAAKARTARISLSDAMGVAPVQNENAPMKTIRIKRPVDIPGAKAPAAPAAAPAADAAAPAADAATTVTQRKTLKIARPAGGVKPAGAKFKKPGSAAAPKAEAAAAEGEVADIADIPDLPAETAPVAPVAAANTVPDVPKAVAVIGLLLQLAACGVIGALVWFLYQDTQLPLFCGGCLP